MHNKETPVIGFAAYSGTGKTTLLTQIIPLLKRAGIRPGVIKHSHHNFEIDKPGKDSYRLRTAGATPVMLVSAYRRAIVTEFETSIELSLADQLQAFDHADVDIILVEGFKSERFPKIEVHRPSLKKPLIYPQDPSVIALASDALMDLPEQIDLLDINNPTQIVQYIIERFLQLETGC